MIRAKLSRGVGIDSTVGSSAMTGSRRIESKATVSKRRGSPVRSIALRTGLRVDEVVEQLNSTQRANDVGDDEITWWLFLCPCPCLWPLLLLAFTFALVFRCESLWKTSHSSFFLSSLFTLSSSNLSSSVINQYPN